MDNLLEKVVQFLVIPESVLSVIFLAIFVLVFAYGVYRVKQCQSLIGKFGENAIAEIKNEENHSTAQQVFSRFIAELTAREVSVNSLPNIFISIGILGTFIGLGVAIHGAADLLSGDKVDIAQLNSVLSVIAFKFQNSIWGTLFSLAFQKFVLEPYYINRQSKLNATDSAIYKEVTNPGLAINELCARQRSIDSALTAQQRALFGENWQDVVDGKNGAAVNSKTGMFQNLSTLGNQLLGENWEQTATGADGKNGKNGKGGKSTQTNMFQTLSALGNQLLGENWEQTANAGSKNGKDGKSAQANMLQTISALGNQLLGENWEQTANADGKNGKDGKSSQANMLQTISALGDQLLGENWEQTANANNKNGKDGKNAKAGLGSMVENIADLRHLMEEQHKELIGDTNAANKENAKQIMLNLSKEMDSQREYVKNMNEQLAAQQRALLGDTLNSGRKSILGDVADQLQEQRKYIDNLTSEQLKLNEVLLGDMQDSNLVAAKNMREGIVRQMEEYKIYAEALAAKQKATQESLENKLQDVMGSMDRNYESSNNSIAELQRAIDILQAAINENSRVLADIVEQFYTKQSNLDKLRRSEIMGIADTFTTLLQQEGKKTAPWNKEIDKQ